MSTPQRPAFMDTPLFVFLSMMWGMVGGAVAGALVGLLDASVMAISGGRWGDAETNLIVMPMVGGFVGMTLGTPIGLAGGVVIAVYVMIRRTALRHDPVDIGRGFPAIALIVVGIAAIWAYVWVHGGKGSNLEFDLWAMLPGTIAAAVTAWYAARSVARAYLRAQGHQNEALARIFPRRRNVRPQVTPAEPSTMDQ